MDISAIPEMQMNDETYFDSSEFIPQLKQTHSAPQTRMKGESIINKYRHKSINTLYYLQPNSKSVFFLDFKKQMFAKE